MGKRERKRFLFLKKKILSESESLSVVSDSL